MEGLSPLSPANVLGILQDLSAKMMMRLPSCESTCALKSVLKAVSCRRPTHSGTQVLQWTQGPQLTTRPIKDEGNSAVMPVEYWYDEKHGSKDEISDSEESEIECDELD